MRGVADQPQMRRGEIFEDLGLTHQTNRLRRTTMPDSHHTPKAAAIIT